MSSECVHTVCLPVSVPRPTIRRVNCCTRHDDAKTRIADQNTLAHNIMLCSHVSVQDGAERQKLAAVTEKVNRNFIVFYRVNPDWF